MNQYEPPLGRSEVLTCDGWWGSGWFLLKGQPVDEIKHPIREEPEPKVGEAVRAALEALPGEFARFGRARWRNNGYVCERPVADWQWAVDAEFLLYAEAQVGVDKWRRVLAKGIPGNCTEVLLGLRKGDPVAVIAPRFESQS